MRKALTVLGAAFLLVVIWWVAIAQSGAIVAPFASTPRLDAGTGSPNNGYNLLARKGDGTYLQLQYRSNNPFSLISSAADLMDLLSAGVANLIAAPSVPANTGRASSRYALGKFSTTGTPGVAFASFFGQNINVFLGTASFSFSSMANYPVGQTLAGILAADFNGDSAMDLAVPYEGPFNGTGGVAILMNQGNGVFNPAVSLTAGTHPNSVVAFDFNKDGKLDLAASDFDTAKLYVLLGNGNGTFAAAVPFNTGSGPRSVAAADFNNDGSIDLVSSGNSGSVSVLLGNGAGAFGAPNTTSTGLSVGFGYVAAGDFNNDARMDVAVINFVQNTLVIMVGRPQGGFDIGPTYNISYSPESLVLADYNADGKLDVLVADGDARGIGGDSNSDHIDILIGRGDGTFIGSSSRPTPSGFGGFVVAADFDLDGRPDAVVNDYFGSKLYVLNGAPNASFAPPLPINLSSGSQVLANNAAVGDFNGDGRPDLAITEEGPNLVGILMNSTGLLTPPTTFSSGGQSPKGIVVGDWDGDGRQDLAVTNAANQSTPGNTAVFRGSGSGTFQLLNTYPTGNEPAKLITADVNGDGKPDLLVADLGIRSTTNTAGAIYVLLNNGGGNFQSPVPFNATFSPSHVAAGDLNGDGIVDLVVPGQDNSFSFQLGILRGNGNGTFQAPVFLTTDFGPTTAVVRDFDADGKVDIVVAHCCGDTDMTFAKGKGDGTFFAEVHFNGGASPNDVVSTDLDHNGMPDLVIISDDGAVTGLLNTSAASTVCVLSPTVLSPSSNGGNFTINVVSGNCALGATGLPDWITVSGTTASSITLTVAANPAGARSATFTIAGITITVNQSAVSQCIYSISPGQAFSGAGGTGSIGISVAPGCPWDVSGAPFWITPTSPVSGTGSGTVNYNVAANTGAARSANLNAAGLPYFVEQMAGTVAGLNFIGSMPHLASQNFWETIFTMVNLSGSTQQARLSLFADSGAPLNLPFTSPPPPLLGAGFDRTLNANASLVMRSNGSDTAPVLTGGAQLAGNGNVGGFVVFRYTIPGQEAVVPLETRNANSYLLAYDNTNGVALGVGVQNVSANDSNVNVIVRDDTGAVLATGTLNLPGNGHTSFVMNLQYPQTNNKRGTIEFQTPAGGRISALGVRFTPPGTLTTIPVLANVGTSGGSMAHLATGGGWKTTIVLMNTGSTASATVNIFDDNGNPLAIPMTFPQGGAAVTAASVNRAIPAQAQLVIESEGPANTPVQVGSIQVNTAANISGYVIFRYQPNGQEAVVPLEDRNAPSYILAFDNSSGLATGVAVNNANPNPAVINVIERDENGSLLGNTTLTLQGNGHASFVLSDQYPITAGKRGTIEFVTPASGRISALGIRTQIPKLTFTTLPPLVR